MSSSKNTSDKETVNLLKELISIDSTNPFETKEENGRTVGKGNEKRIAERLYELLEANGFTVRRQVVEEKEPDRYNLIAEKGTGEKSVLFVGHMDTVEVKNGWTTDPFTATEKDGRIYGLGSNDMKAGIAAIINATKSLEPTSHKIKVALVVDEEYWSYGADKLIESDFLKDVAYAFVPEAGEFDKRTSKQPIVLGRMGRTEYEITIKGRSCHGAQARVNKHAINAVHEAAKVQEALINYCERCAKTFEEEGMSITNSAYLSRIEGGKATLSVPEHARIILDRSFVPGEDMEKEIEAVKAAVAEADTHPEAEITVKERYRPTKPAKSYYVRQSNPAVKGATAIVDEILGGHEYGIAYSVADENRLNDAGIPTITLGPTGEGSHAPDEWVDIASLEKLTTIYRRLAERLFTR